MKYLATILACLVYLLPVQAQTPDQVARWVLEETIIEFPREFTVLHYTPDGWEDFMKVINLPQSVDAVTNRQDMWDGKLIIHLGPDSRTDFHIIHETIHYMLDKLHGSTPDQPMHSEFITQIFVATIVCAGSSYGKWKSSFEYGWDLLPAYVSCTSQGLLEYR